MNHFGTPDKIQPIPCPCCGGLTTVSIIAAQAIGSLREGSFKLEFVPYLHPLPSNVYLTFEALRAGNLDRVGQFKNRRGEVAHSSKDGSDWTIAEWGNAMAGEAGEACNFAKKLRRGDFADPKQGEALLLKELADVVIYADLMAYHAHGYLGDAVRQKFNEKSDEIGCTVKI